MNFKLSFKNLSIASKLTWVMLLLVLFSVISVGFLAVSKTKKALKKTALLNLQSRSSGFENTIALYFENIIKESNYLASNELLKQNVESLNTNEIVEIEPECIEFIQYFSKEFNYEDATLYGEEKILYSNSKSNNSNIKIPSLKLNATEFGIPFSENSNKFIYLYKNITSNNQSIGTLVLKIKLQYIFDILSNENALGETGEVLLGVKNVSGANFINSSRFNKGENFQTVKKGNERGIPILNAVNKIEGQGSSIDYRGEKVTAVWRYIPLLKWGIVSKVDDNQIFKPISSLSKTLFLWTLFIIFVSVVITILFSRKISKAILSLEHIIQNLSAGNKVSNIEISTSKDEIGRMINASIELAKFQNNVIEFSQNVSNKDFEKNKSLEINRGEIGNALITMEANLIRVAEEDEIKRWSNEGIAKFSTIIRDFSSDSKTFSSMLISELVLYMDCLQGGIFALNEDNTVLNQISFYGLDRKEFEEQSLQKGDGLLWQTIEDREYILLNEIPNNYIAISSGLGNSQPSSIIVIPLIINEIVYGVLELATFKSFHDHEIDFLKIISENIAGALANIKINLQTQKLLTLSQSKTQELSVQEETTRQNLEIMQAGQEEMERIKNEIETKEAMLFSLVNTSEDTYFCIDTNYRVLVANDALQKRMRANGEELQMGVNILDTLNQEQTNHWKPIYDRIFEGETFSNDVERKVGDETLYVKAIYKPVRNKNNEIIGASVMSTDVTDVVKIKMRLKVLENKLND